MKTIYFKENELFSKILELVLYLSISLYPLYVFDSGSIQISHFLLITFSVCILISRGIFLDKYFFTFLIFLIYCYLLNFFYNSYNFYIFSSDSYTKYFKDMIFISYNFILTISLITYFNYHKKYYAILNGLLTAILIIMISFFYDLFFSDGIWRFVGFFNNPNQLGYFCTCCFSLIYVFYRNSYINYYVMIFLIGVTLIITIATASKAATFALFICIFFSIIPVYHKYPKFIIIIFCSLILFFINLFFLQLSDSILVNRLVNFMGEQDSSLAVRGYYIFLESSNLQFIFGMGLENLIDIKGLEIHSTLMMIFTSYGLIGFLIFSSLLLFWMLDIKKSYGLIGVICVCGPTLLYGLTHNGIRFSMFWIIFVVSIMMSKNLIQKNIHED